MIDGGFKQGGPTPLFLAAISTIPPPTTSCGLGPAVYLTVHFREGLTEVKAVGGGVEGRDWQGVCAVPSRDVPCGTVPGCAVGRRDRASTVD